MTISKKIEAFMTRSSWIRKMFEEGARLKAAHGPENVFDFSLGNPNLEPPEKFNQILGNIVKETGGHGYMPQAGYPHVREKIAEYISKDQGVAVTANDVVMTCGAAGALNIICRSAPSWFSCVNSGNERFPIRRRRLKSLALARCVTAACRLANVCSRP